MMSQTGQQIMTKHALSNISKSNDNKTMKFGQLTQYDVVNIFLQRSCRKWGSETSSRLLFVFEKALYKVKESGQHFSYNIFWKTLTLT